MALAYAVTSVRNAMLNTIPAAIGASGFCDIYDGTRPATGGTITTLLAHLPLSATSAPASSAGVLTFNAITTANAVATSTATWGRLTTSGGTFVADFSVAASGSDLNLTSTSIVSGQPVAVTSFVITEGNP